MSLSTGISRGHGKPNARRYRYLGSILVRAIFIHYLMNNQFKCSIENNSSRFMQTLKLSNFVITEICLLKSDLRQRWVLLKMVHTGHCLCNAPTYSIDVEKPLMVGFDHYDDCQRATGTAYCTFTTLPFIARHILTSDPCLHKQYSQSTSPKTK